MSLRLQGKIIRFPLMKYAKSMNIDISERAISPLKLLWISLADFQNEKSGQCNPSIKTLAACIEKSESQTTLYMGLLKKLGLVVAARHAKGGRTTPQYELPMPSHPVDKSASPPIDDAPEISSETTPLAESGKGSYLQDSTPLINRTRILIEALDEPLIKSLIHEKDVFKRNIGLTSYAKKYGYKFENNTPMHEVEAWLLKAIKQSIPHRTNHGNY